MEGAGRMEGGRKMEAGGEKCELDISTIDKRTVHC